MIFILLIMPAYGFAQSPYDEDVVEVIVEKGGKLENALKKANALGAKKLFINSHASKRVELNEKDLKFLLGMSHLEELYLNATTEGAVGYKYNAYSGKSSQEDLKLTNSRFPNIQIIGIGENAANGWYKLFDLDVKGLVLYGESSKFPQGISFDDLYIISQPNDYFKDYSIIDNDGNWITKPDVNWGKDFSRLIDSDRLKIHSIHVKSRNWLNAEICRSLNPAVIYIHNDNKTEKYLANYNSNLHEEDKDLSQYDGILLAALSNTTFNSITLPDNQDEIGDRFFNNLSSNNVDLNKVRTIGKNAFYGSHIKEVYIPATVQDIDEKAFDNSEIGTVFLEGKYAPAINVSYVPEGFENIQFIIPKGTKKNYNIGVWKQLRVLEDGASTDFAFDVKEPGTLASLLTDDIKQSVVSLKLRGILYSDDIKLLEDCPNLTHLDISETFIVQSPKELKEKQETSDYLAGLFMNMGVIAQSEFEHDRMSTTDNLQVQFLAKLGEMARNEKIESDPNCQVPDLHKTSIQELRLPIQLGKVNYKAFPKNLKKVVLPPYLKEFEASPYTMLSEIVLPSSVRSINIKSSNIKYKDLQTIDLSACINPKIELDAQFEKLETLKLPESYVPESYNGGKRLQVSSSIPLHVYFKGRELIGGLRLSAPYNKVRIYIPKGSRAGYSSFISDGFEITEH